MADENYVSRSVNITQEHKDYVEENNINLSKTVRDIIDGSLESESAITDIKDIVVDIRDYIEDEEIQDKEDEVLNKLDLILQRLENVGEKVDKLLGG